MMDKGLYNKYHVEIIGSNLQPTNADYFVLRLDTDKHARVAAIEYARSVLTDKPRLAADLVERVHWYENKERKKHTFIKDLPGAEQKQIVRDMLGDNDL